MGAADWIVAGAAVVTTLLALGGIFLSYGAHKNATDNLKGDVAKLDARMTAVEGLKVSVEGLTKGIENFNDRLSENRQLTDSHLQRLADAVTAGQKLTDQRFDAMKELSARELDELKHGMRAMLAAVQPVPATRRTARKPAS